MIHGVHEGFVFRFILAIVADVMRQQAVDPAFSQTIRQHVPGIYPEEPPNKTIRRPTVLRSDGTLGLTPQVGKQPMHEWDHKPLGRRRRNLMVDI